MKINEWLNWISCRRCLFFNQKLIYPGNLWFEVGSCSGWLIGRALFPRRRLRFAVVIEWNASKRFHRISLTVAWKSAKTKCEVITTIFFSGETKHSYRNNLACCLMDGNTLECFKTIRFPWLSHGDVCQAPWGFNICPQCFAFHFQYTRHLQNHNFSQWHRIHRNTFSFASNTAQQQQQKQQNDAFSEIVAAILWFRLCLEENDSFSPFRMKSGKKTCRTDVKSEDLGTEWTTITCYEHV